MANPSNQGKRIRKLLGSKDRHWMVCQLTLLTFHRFAGTSPGKCLSWPYACSNRKPELMRECSIAHYRFVRDQSSSLWGIWPFDVMILPLNTQTKTQKLLAVSLKDVSRCVCSTQVRGTPGKSISNPLAGSQCSHRSWFRRAATRSLLCCLREWCRFAHHRRGWL